MPVITLKGWPVAALICCLLVSASSAAELLQVGQYHGSEVKSKTGLTWLGLFPGKAGSYELCETKVQITLVNDPVEDEPKAKTGKLIAVSTKKQPILLVREIAGLKSGQVATCSANAQFGERLNCGQTLNLKLAGKAAKLLVSGSANVPNKSEEEILKGYKLVLECGGVKQTLYAQDEITATGSPTLLWAGDLDRDGKVDLFINMTNHYNLSKPTLFLSSKAKPGKLVEEVVSISAVGC